MRVLATVIIVITRGPQRISVNDRRARTLSLLFIHKHAVIHADVSRQVSIKVSSGLQGPCNGQQALLSTILLNKLLCRHSAFVVQYIKVAFILRTRAFTEQLGPQV